jgi:predicted MFS family arabinose efflux permease
MLWEMSGNDLLISFSFMACFTYITGWFTDRILESSGFGHIGNWLIVLVGGYAGIVGINMYGYDLEWFPMLTLAAIAGSALFMLLSLCVIKRLVH